MPNIVILRVVGTRLNYFIFATFYSLTDLNETYNTYVNLKIKHKLLVIFSNFTHVWGITPVLDNFPLNRKRIEVTSFLL